MKLNTHAHPSHNQEGKGYHTAAIPRGIFGEASKITEEYHEWLDGYNQSAKILELVELADLLGAIEGYVNKHHNISFQDLVQMKNLTKRAFTDGSRKDGLEGAQGPDGGINPEYIEKKGVISPPPAPQPGFAVVWGDDKTSLETGEYWFGTTIHAGHQSANWWFCTDPKQIMRKGYIYAIKEQRAL